MSTVAIEAAELKTALQLGARRPAERRSLFAWMTLGIIDQIHRGALTPDSAIDHFFHGRNCLYVRRSLKCRLCDEVMGRGVQLPDLFDILPAAKAQQALEQQLAAMEALCQRIIDRV